MFSPPAREKSKDEPAAADGHLPKGDCRYILLHPEVKGLRCACVGFALNRAIPGSTCDCGHQACYHTPDKEFNTIERHELDALKDKISVLEDQLNRERQGGRGGLIDRLGRLEEVMDIKNEENEMEMKNFYRGMSGLWQNVGMLSQRARYYDDRIEGLVDDVQRMQNRLIEIDDASMGMEDRVEALESSKSLTSSMGRRRQASTPPGVLGSPSQREESASPLPLQTDATDLTSVIVKPATSSRAWTVHISLLPTSSQPFPFEKDTAAYKRCLSRGLHRVVAIPDTDSHSFVSAVSEAFTDHLRGRLWMPLVAKLCDAKNLRGLPMLRQLPDHLIGSDYDVEFLKENCAIVDDTGKIDHLYVAMLGATLSWRDLRRSPCFLKGLEDCWEYDPYLDGSCLENEDGGSARRQLRNNGSSAPRPAAGDMIPNFTMGSPTNTRLKRPSSEISRAGSFGSSAEGEGTRAKLRRQCTSTNVEVVGRRAEAV